MTDARIPERYLMDRRVARLSDAAFRAWIVATLWAVANRTDGAIERVDLHLIPQLDAASADALAACGLWSETTDGWQIADYAETQTSRSELEALENVRRREREKKRRQRSSAEDAVTVPVSPGLSTGTVPPSSQGPTQDKEGRKEGPIPSSSFQGNRPPQPPVQFQRDHHEHHERALEALERITAERQLPLSADESMAEAYRLGSGDPWEGYRVIREESERTLDGMNDPGAALRARLRKATPRPAGHRPPPPAEHVGLCGHPMISELYCERGCSRELVTGDEQMDQSCVGGAA